jgi:hypothetical protein
MKFEETELYKLLDSREYKVTLADGTVLKSEKWLKRWNDEENVEITPYVPNKQMSDLRSSTKKKPSSKR